MSPHIVHTLLESKVSRLAELKVGEVLKFPRAEYWRINSARQRAAKAAQARFALRARGENLFVVRVA